MDFKIKSKYHPTGDQPQAIEEISARLKNGTPEQTLIGVTGSGKSVVGKTHVLIKQEEKITQENIGLFIDKLFANFPDRIKSVGESKLILAGDLPLPQFETYSFDPKTNLPSWKPITQFIRHTYTDKPSTVITTCGRNVTVTKNHNFFVLRNGKLRLMTTTNIKRGDFIPVPLGIPPQKHTLTTLPLYNYFPPQRKLFVAIPEFKSLWPTDEHNLRPLLTPTKIHHILRTEERISLGLYQQLAQKTPSLSHNAAIGVYGKNYQFPMELRLHNNIMRLFGYYVAEGHAEDKYFVISSADKEIVSDFTATFAQLGLHWRQRDKTYDYQVSSVFWSELLGILNGKISQKKRLPSFWPQLSNEQLSNLLKAYFSADGGLDGAAITCATASEELASDLTYALLRFGIIARIREKRVKLPRKNTKRTYWVVNISGQKFLKVFQAEIGFSLKRKQVKLASLLDKSYNTNVDIIPIDGRWIHTIRTHLSLFQRDVAKACYVESSYLSMVENNLRKPSQEVFKKIINTLKEFAYAKKDIAAMHEIESKEYLLNLYWTPVREIVEAPKEDYVYDFSVQENETFLAGSGGLFVHNTFTMANVIERVQKPTLVISHNKTLAAQLYQEFKEFFPDNAVRYFVSYYDYYQPEAYIPQTDTYIEKDAKINEFIDRLRHASTQSLLTRRDVIIVASVSCIYGLGDPAEYGSMAVSIRAGQKIKQNDFLKTLAALQYERNDTDPQAGTFSIKGDMVEIVSPTGMETTRVEFFGNEIEQINKDEKNVQLFPAKHFVTASDKLEQAIANIEQELEAYVATLQNRGKALEAERLRERTRFDMEMLRTTGYCSGIENYSRHLSFRNAGDPPATLLDYFPKDFITFIDESHMTLPQIRGMYQGDRARKQTLIEHGFRLPSALDNRPLMFEEFESRVPQVVYVSATPGHFELSSGPASEQLVRPTGLLDPDIEIRPAKNQIHDAAVEIKKRAAAGERTLVTTITKRLAEDIADYLSGEGIKTAYIHAEVKTLERTETLQNLRKGAYDALVGINLLREGLDIPEVSLVAILDADKEGFLRNAITLIQTMGRAARHVNGHVILYADTITGSMKEAIETAERRRKIQEAYNKEHGIVPAPVTKEIRGWFPADTKKEDILEQRLEEKILEHKNDKRSLQEFKKELEADMRKAAAKFDFEKAAALRDMIQKLQ